MRIVTWNCQGAFRKKIEFILELTPDILIIQECEALEKLDLFWGDQKPKHSYWYCDQGKKELALFIFTDYKIELLNEFNPQFRYILPFRLSNEQNSITLFAIWAMNNKENRVARYIGQVWFAINHYDRLLSSATILIGDFNSNKIWDYKDRVGSHSDVVNKLGTNEISSVYHSHFNIEQGKETHPTLYLYRKKDKPYHIDYCFVSDDLLKKLKSVEVGGFEKWIGYSDHMPVTIDIDI